MENTNSCNGGLLAPDFQFLLIEDIEGDTSRRRIAYQKINGSKKPGVTFIPGFLAIKEHKKPVDLLQYCLNNDLPYIRYDSTGLGDSDKEVKRTEARFSHWVEDAREILLQLTDGPQIVVGSSMGAWIAMILARQIPHKFAGLVLLAPAYNFWEKGLASIETLPEEIKDELKNGGVIERVNPLSPEYGPTPISYRLFEEMIPYELALDRDALEINVPVRIIHGLEDEVIPYENSVPLINAITSENVRLIFVKGLKHELSDPVGLQMIRDCVEELLEIAAKSPADLKQPSNAK